MQNKAPRTLRNSRKWLQFKVDDLRHQLAHADALPLLTVLGLICGIAAALLIVLFRQLIDFPLEMALINGSEDFESLPPFWRLTLASCGGLIVGLLLHFLSTSERKVGVSHVIDRLHNHQAKLPLKNLLVQFFGGVICLLSGQSVGREGPAVHIGGACASLLGQWLKLPHNSLRTMVGCGVAAAIAASFNTPMAGVIFAMEVVLMEYTIVGFLPVILASASGAAISQAIYGPEPAFNLGLIQMNSLWELPFMVAAGLIIAVVAAAFIRLHLLFSQLKHWSIIVRCALGGAITGIIAIAIPQVMGIGYDTLSSAFQGQLGLALLLAIVAAKLLATTACTGLGQPGGLIGPVFMIGGCLGAVLGLSGQLLIPDSGATPAFYVMIGMGGLVAAVLDAPLAALIAVLELTYNPNILFPSMIAIVIACVTTRHVFGCKGIFTEILQSSNTSLNRAPLRQALDRASVRSVMDTDFVRSPFQISYSEAHKLLSNHPRWVIAEELGKSIYLLSAASVADFLANAKEKILLEEVDIDLKSIPGKRMKLSPISQQSSLYEAHRRLTQDDVEALYVESGLNYQTPMISPALGIVTLSQIEDYYLL